MILYPSRAPPTEDDVHPFFVGIGFKATPSRPHRSGYFLVLLQNTWSRTRFKILGDLHYGNRGFSLKMCIKTKT